MEIGDSLQSGCRLFLDFFSEVIWNEKIMDIALIALEILVVGPYRGILVILCLHTTFC